MSTRNPTHGTKVTDPNAPVKVEAAGIVTKDSLAAESETFSENKLSTPASDKPAPQDTVQQKPATSHDDQAHSHDHADSKDKSVNVGSSSNTATSSKSNHSVASTAPSYVHTAGHRTDGPHGKGLSEGGFESDDKHNASFTSKIGSKDDPGRLAVEKMIRANAQAAADAGMPSQKQVAETGIYDALDSDKPA